MNVISSVLRMGHARFLSADLPTEPSPRTCMRFGHPWTVAQQPRMNVISSVLRIGSCPIFVRGPPHSDRPRTCMRCGHPWTVAEQPRMNVISSVLRMGHARFLSADLPTVISKNMEMWTSVDRRKAAQDERHILRPKDGSPDFCPRTSPQ